MDKYLLYNLEPVVYILTSNLSFPPQGVSDVLLRQAQPDQLEHDHDDTRTRHFEL